MARRRDPEIVNRAIKRMVRREGKRGGFYKCLTFTYMTIANELRSKMFKYGRPFRTLEMNIVCMKWHMRGIPKKVLREIRAYIEQENIKPRDRKAERALKKSIMEELS